MFIMNNLKTYCLNICIIKDHLKIFKRFSNTLFPSTLEKHRNSELSHDREDFETIPPFEAPKGYKARYVDFLPNPDWKKRDRISEKLERQDMLRRRANIDIPEFYVGSILAITVCDPHATLKENRFVGICVARDGHGLRSNFTLRNIVDGNGIEIMYEMYNPTLKKISVLKLEKRLDNELYYLRDCDPKYSTFNFNMEQIPHPPGASVPLNDLIIKINPRPWNRKWQNYNFKGLSGIEEHLKEIEKIKTEKLKQPWEEYDLMKMYRKSITKEESNKILAEVYQSNLNFEKTHGKKNILTS